MNIYRKLHTFTKERFKRTTTNLRETNTFPSMSVPSASPTTNKKQKTKPRLHWPDASDKQPSQSCKTRQCKHRCKSAAESGRGDVSEYPVNPTHRLPGHPLASQLSRRPVARSLGANDAPCTTGHSATPARAAHRERGHEKLSWANAQHNKKKKNTHPLPLHSNTLHANIKKTLCSNPHHCNAMRVNITV